MSSPPSARIMSSPPAPASLSPLTLPLSVPPDSLTVITDSLGLSIAKRVPSPLISIEKLLLKFMPVVTRKSRSKLSVPSVKVTLFAPTRSKSAVPEKPSTVIIDVDALVVTISPDNELSDRITPSVAAVISNDSSEITPVLPALADAEPPTA